MQPTTDKPSDHSLDLAVRRTGLAFQRTRLAADRTLMAFLRTALSLISFGFGFFSFFTAFRKAGLETKPEPVEAALKFSLLLVLIGIGTLAAGIFEYVRLMRAIRAQRKELIAEHMLRGKLPFNVGAVVFAGALVAAGFMVMIAILFRAGPLH